ncbi:MAG TPA: hypothetical protein VEK07_11100 [Polyangiaceae bacterium]|nr:hypothetical protein [Polyangiaceae bacterium]
MQLQLGLPVARMRALRERKIAFLGALDAMALAATGCHGCHSDHPYVPYAIGSVERAAQAANAAPESGAPPTPAGPAGDPFALRESVLAPPPTSRWNVGGLTLEAPDGLVFVAAVVGDVDASGIQDAFAIVRPADGNDPGEALYYRSKAPSGIPAVVATFAPPPGLAREGSCTAIDRLGGLGRDSVLVELGARCSQSAESRPLRWVAVVNGGDQPAVRLALTIADPAGAPDLTVEASVADRDKDGRDDVALRVSLEGGGAPLEPGPRVSATLAWLDRPAGLSRDAEATESSFEALAESAMRNATRAQTAPEVPRFAAQARALWRALCAGGGNPRVQAVAGTGAIACGAGLALEDLGLAEVKAYIAMGDPLRAALALDRADRPPAMHTAPRVAEAQKWIASLAPIATARMLRAIAALPEEPRGREPAWGPLAFEASGKLLVETRAGVVRVDPDFGDEAPAGLSAWDTRVVSPDASARWIETYDPCDGLPLRALFELASGVDDRDIALPVAAPLAARCFGSRGAPMRSVPIAWGSRGLEALLEGDIVLISPDLSQTSVLTTFLTQPSKPGAPRSPDGKTYVFATDAGLVVRGEAHTRLLRGSELDATYAEQRDCTVSNDATHVACVRAGRAWVGTWDAP